MKQKRSRLTDTESKLGVTSGKRGRKEGQNRSRGLKMGLLGDYMKSCVCETFENYKTEFKDSFIQFLKKERLSKQTNKKEPRSKQSPTWCKYHHINPLGLIQMGSPTRNDPGKGLS